MRWVFGIGLARHYSVLLHDGKEVSHILNQVSVKVHVLFRIQLNDIIARSNDAKVLQSCCKIAMPISLSKRPSSVGNWGYREGDCNTIRTVNVSF